MAAKDNRNGAERQRRPRAQPPPLELMQHTVAHGFAQIIVNMVDAEYQRVCCELLGITDTGQAKAALLRIVQELDAKKEAAGDASEQRKRRRQEDSA